MSEKKHDAPHSFSFRIEKSSKNVIRLEIGGQPVTLDTLEKINFQMNELLDQAEQKTIVIGYPLDKLDLQVGISTSPTIRKNREKYISYLDHPNLKWMGISYGANIFMNVIASMVTYITGTLKIFPNRESLEKAVEQETLA